MEMILNDMDVLTLKIDNLENEFQPVRKGDNGEFITDLSFNFFECYFVPYPNKLETHEFGYFEYPILYLSDHGVYVYSIIDIEIGDDQIGLHLEKIYHQDENTKEYNIESTTPFYVYFQDIEGKWILHYMSDYLMMEKDSENIRVIDSNEGQ